MNQTQRDFLIKNVEQTHKNQIAELKNQIPNEPSLNNYLIAAFLDNSIKFNDISQLKEKIRDTVIRMGAGDVLVKSEKNWRNKEIGDTNKVTILAEDLFILPDNYIKARYEYEQIKSEIESQVRDLDEKMKTIIMKIQIGSNQVLDKLITQVDNMADLNIMNKQFLLTN